MRQYFHHGANLPAPQIVFRQINRQSHYVKQSDISRLAQFPHIHYGAVCIGHFRRTTSDISDTVGSVPQSVRKSTSGLPGCGSLSCGNREPVLDSQAIRRRASQQHLESG